MNCIAALGEQQQTSHDALRWVSPRILKPKLIHDDIAKGSFRRLKSPSRIQIRNSDILERGYQKCLLDASKIKILI